MIEVEVEPISNYFVVRRGNRILARTNTLKDAIEMQSLFNKKDKEVTK